MSGIKLSRVYFAAVGAATILYAIVATAQPPESQGQVGNLPPRVVSQQQQAGLVEIPLFDRSGTHRLSITYRSNRGGNTDINFIEVATRSQIAVVSASGTATTYPPSGPPIPSAGTTDPRRLSGGRPCRGTPEECARSDSGSSDNYLLQRLRSLETTVERMRVQLNGRR